MIQEAQARKKQSIARLRAEDVPYIDHLPVIESESESTRRSSTEVSIRAMALCVVALKGEGLEDDLLNQIINNYQLSEAFTPNERLFVNNLSPDQTSLIQFSWRYECY